MKIFVLSFTIYLQIISFGLHAQELDRRLKPHLSEMNMTFTMPEKYVSIDTGFYFKCGDYKEANGILYTIMRADSNVKVAIGVSPYPNSRTIASNRLYIPTWDPEKSYIIKAKVLADTINHKLIFYDREYICKRNNADNGCELVRNCVPYQEKYIYNRHLIIAKRGRGFFELNYLYTEKAKRYIDKEIERTMSMLRYKD